MIEKIYEKFGSELPSRSGYNAHRTKDFTVRAIEKQFGNWKAFARAYAMYAVQQRTKEAAKIVTK